MQKTKRILSIILVLVVVIVFVIALVITKRANNRDRFSAEFANITIDLNTSVKATEAEAAEETTGKMNEIIAELKELNIEEEDVEIVNYSVNPFYSWTEESGQVLEGYEAVQQVVVKVRELDRVGEVIAKTTEKGASPAGEVVFSVDGEWADPATPSVVACTMEVKTCSDGSFVGRIGPNCDFMPCPSDKNVIICTEEAKICPDGSTVSRTGPNCEFSPCPVSPPVTGENPIACTADAKVCPDGSAVGRVGPNCEFAPCP